MSEPKAAPSRQAQARTIAPGAWRVQLGAAKEEARAKSSLARIAKANADVLKDLNPEIARADLGAKGVYYRMRLGPLPDKAAADALCRKLADRKVGCIVVKP
jgi:cell division septation protein DedD